MANWELKEGFVYHIYPTSEEAKIREDLSDQGGPVEMWGFHGNDVSPVIDKIVETEERTEIHLDNAQRNYEYFADGDGNDSQADGFLVFSESDEAPEVVEGWEADEWDCESGWTYGDEAGYKIVCVEEEDRRYSQAATFAVNM